MANAANALYRLLPGVDEVLGYPGMVQLVNLHGRDQVIAAARTVLQRLRGRVRTEELGRDELNESLVDVSALVREVLADSRRPRLRRVINATGVILQTNLGRAPLSEAALKALVDVAQGYCNLEFDVATGERGHRDGLVEDRLLQVVGFAELTAYSTAVVNNCAAATFLALNTLAEGGEVIVSRGELVEIGGGFRVPDILAKSGAVLREVGTTNKTRLQDYAGAVNPNTRLLLRVHRSNFEIRGFTEQPSLEELVDLGRQVGVPVFEDQGTGCLLDLAEVGLSAESSWKRSVQSAAALVACSGDKLLGGPQCGLLVGDRAVIARLRANPLYRALRADKLTYAALERTLEAYASGQEETIPVIAMLRTPAETVRQRCVQWAETLRSECCEVEVVPVRSVIGGGTTPGASLASYAVAIRVAGTSERALAARLRELTPAVIGRVHEGRVLLDLRTVFAGQDTEVLGVLGRALSEHTSRGACGEN